MALKEENKFTKETLLKDKSENDALNEMLSQTENEIELLKVAIENEKFLNKKLGIDVEKEQLKFSELELKLKELERKNKELENCLNKSNEQIKSVFSR